MSIEIDNAGVIGTRRRLATAHIHVRDVNRELSIASLQIRGHSVNIYSKKEGLSYQQAILQFSNLANRRKTSTIVDKNKAFSLRGMKIYILPDCNR